MRPLSVLIDTGILYAFLNRQDPGHAVATDLLRGIAAGDLGSPVVSEHVVDELFTLIRHRKAPRAVEEAACTLLPLDGPSALRLRIVVLGAAGLPPALELYRRHRDRALSFTDATHLVLMRRLAIDRLATLDQGLRGLVPIVPG